MTTTTIEKKIARLQIMLWSLTLLFAAILAWLLLAPRTPGTLRAEAFELVDDGRVVAVLHGEDSRGALVMYFKESGSLSFFGQNGDVLREISARDLRGSK